MEDSFKEEYPHKVLIDQIFDLKDDIENSPGSWNNYEQWFRKSPYKSMGRSYCYYLYSAANVYRNEKPYDSLKEQEKRLYDSFPRKAQEHIKIVKNYISTVSKYDFDEKEWYFYFLSVAERRGKNLKVARTLLSTSRGGKADLKNVDDGFSDDYEGTYGLIEGDRKVVYFDLKNNPNKVTRELHIKITYHRPKDEIMMGTYTTYDEQFVYSGLAVLEQITNSNFTDDDKKPVLCSFDHNPDQFKLIHPAIRKYLSLKNRNHRNVPSPPIPNIGELENYLSEYTPMSNMKNRFLELEKPRLYLATPQGAKKMLENGTPVLSDVDALIEEIKGNLRDKNIEIICKETDPNEPAADLKSTESLRLLKRTRFFVLVLTEVDKASYSLIQFGWAMAHCKNLMIVYQDKNVSNRIKAIKNATKYPYESLDSQESRKSIAKEIKRFVTDNM